ncbi:penicillin-binding protein activator LpoB [Desulfovibrio sp. OttesenSCG-928-C14]|nr:penicillin-binding protein activator LpoB [Desulfovibrio sp. OttesenSCG-928-C14]
MKQSNRSGAAYAGAGYAQSSACRQPSGQLRQSLQRVLPSFLVLLALFLILNLSGCSALSQNSDFDLAGQPTMSVEQEIRKSKLMVHVRPVSDVSGLKVVFVPFRMTQKIENAELTGYAVGKLFWQTWAGMQVFDQMEYLGSSGPFRQDTALRLAKGKGADLLVSGYITNLLSGATSGQSSLALQLEAYDVQSGLLVWSMAQAATLPRPQSHDYILFSTRSRMPEDPVYALTTSIAGEMGQVMRAWSQRDAIEAAKLRKEEEEAQKSFGAKAADFFTAPFTDEEEEDPLLREP